MLFLANFFTRKLDPRQFNSLFVGAALAVCTVIMVTVTVLSLAHHGVLTEEYRLICFFEKGLGLRIGAQVQVNGVGVGQVENIELTSDGQVKLTLAIKKEKDPFTGEPSLNQHITTNSMVFATRAQNLISERVLNITQGTATGQILNDGDVIPSTEAQDIETVLASVLDLLQKVDKIVDNSDKLIQMSLDPKSTIGALIGSRELYDNITLQINRLGEIGTTSKGLLDNINRQLPGILDRVDTFSHQAVQLGDNFLTVSVKTEAMVGSMDTTIFALNNMIGDLEEILKSAGHMLSGSETTLESVDDMVGSVNEFWFIKNDIPDKSNVPLLLDQEW
jgi:phospholipid/cholesterol/gamma-HCH transport system substrate-binding protein